MGHLRTGVYRHYKGNLYEVMGVAMHSETGEKLVVYKALYDNPDLAKEFGLRPLFVRPYDMFVEDVEVGGKKQPRFAFEGQA